MKAEITRESIEKAINDGAKTISQIALAHGYEKPISGGTTSKIRAIVPEVADLITARVMEEAAEKVNKPAVAAEVAPETVIKAEKKGKTPKAPKVAKVVKEKAVKVPKAPKVKAEKAPKVAKEKPVKAPKVVKEKTPKVPKVKAVKVVKEKAVKVEREESGDAVGVQRKASYGGKVYGRVFAEALAAGEVEFRPFVAATAVKLGIEENAVFFALSVMRMAKHQSNGHRSKDISGKRGWMNLVAIEHQVTPEAVPEAVAAVTEPVAAEPVAAEAVAETVA